MNEYKMGLLAFDLIVMCG